MRKQDLSPIPLGQRDREHANCPPPPSHPPPSEQANVQDEAEFRGAAYPSSQHQKVTDGASASRLGSVDFGPK
jgi:hypothetical protein